MSSATRKGKGRAQAAATPTTDHSSSSSFPSASIPASTSITATTSLDTPAIGPSPTTNILRAAAGNSNPSTSGPNPSADDDMEVVDDGVETAKDDVEMVDRDTVMDNAHDGGAIPGPSRYRGPVPDNLGGDTDVEGDLGEDMKLEGSFEVFLYPTTEREKFLNLMHDIFVEGCGSYYGLLTSGELMQRQEESALGAKYIARGPTIRYTAEMREKEKEKAEANVKAKAARLAAEAKARVAIPRMGATKPPGSTTAHPDPSKPPLHLKLPVAVSAPRNPLHPPKFGIRGGGHCFTANRSIRSTRERRGLKNGTIRERFTELIKAAKSPLTVSVRANEDGELEYDTEEEEVVLAMRTMSFIDTEVEDNDELEDDERGFDGDCEGSGRAARFRKKGKGRALPKRVLKRSREEDDDDTDERDGKQDRVVRPMKKHRTLRFYEGSDEDTPVASASQAEHDINAINESDEPSMGFEDNDNE